MSVQDFIVGAIICFCVVFLEKLVVIGTYYVGMVYAVLELKEDVFEGRVLEVLLVRFCCVHAEVTGLGYIDVQEPFLCFSDGVDEMARNDFWWLFRE